MAPMARLRGVLPACTTPGTHKWGSLHLCCPQPPPRCPLCLQGSSVRRGEAAQNYAGGVIFKANGAGGSGFPQAAKKGCIESWGGQSTGTQQHQPLPGPTANVAGGGAKTLLGAWFGAGLWGGCWLWGQPQGAPLPPSLSCGDSLLSRSGLSLPCGFRYWWQLFRAIYFTKYLLSRLGPGLAGRSKSCEDEGQASRIGAIS